MSDNYVPKFQHQDWVDNVDLVSAGDHDKGFNKRFRDVQREFDEIARSLTFLSTSGATLTGGDLTLKATADDPGDIIFQDSLGNQKGRIWSQASSGTGLYLSSGDNYPDISIDAIGNVGIGTPNPGAKLEINGNVRTGGFEIGNPTNQGSTSLTISLSAASGGYSELQSVKSAGTAWGDIILNASGGNVGIGTNTPGAKLDINANVQTAGGWFEAIRFSQSAHSAITHPGGGLLFGLHSDRSFYFTDIKDGAFQKHVMKIDAATGNVGIGTATPKAKLEVKGGITILEQENWSTPPLLSDWVNYDMGYSPVGYFKDSMGIVHLRGLIKKDGAGEPISNDPQIFSLPSGYQPKLTEIFCVHTHPDAPIGRIDVRPDGVFAIYGNTQWISLSGITFRAEQ